MHVAIQCKEFIHDPHPVVLDSLGTGTMKENTEIAPVETLRVMRNLKDINEDD